MSEQQSYISSSRKRRGLSQRSLAALVGVSQATISRIEKREYKPGLKLISKIARALDIDVSEMIEGEGLGEMRVSAMAEAFYAFCPNPFCERNEFRSDGETPVVVWKSGSSYSSERYEEVNFCPRCGTELVKECPSCGKPLEDKGSRFCMSCGSKLVDRPTTDEWAEIKRLLEARGAVDDDIPF